MRWVKTPRVDPRVGREAVDTAQRYQSARDRATSLGTRPSRKSLLLCVFRALRPVEAAKARRLSGQGTMANDAFPRSLAGISMTTSRARSS